MPVSHAWNRDDRPRISCAIQNKNASRCVMAERWCYPVAQAMQRHTGCRYVKPKVAPSTVPEEAPPAEQAAPGKGAAPAEIAPEPQPL